MLGLLNYTYLCGSYKTAMETEVEIQTTGCFRYFLGKDTDFLIF